MKTPAHAAPHGRGCAREGGVLRREDQLPGALSAYTSRLTLSTNSGDLQSVTITRNVDGQIRPVRSATRYERRWFSETIARPCKLPIPALVYGVGSCGGGPAVSGDLQRTVPAGHPTECPSLCQEMGSVGDGRSGAVLISSHVGHRFPAGHFSHSLSAAGPNPRPETRSRQYPTAPAHRPHLATHTHSSRWRRPLGRSSPIAPASATARLRMISFKTFAGATIAAPEISTDGLHYYRPST